MAIIESLINLEEYMEYISHQALEQLMKVNTDAPVATIYVPMHPTASPPHITENQIRFKNLINKAADELRALDVQSQLASELCETLNQLHDDQDFWKSQTPGLLICASPDKIQMFHLPVDTEEYVAIDDKFHLASVLSIVNDQQEYYVLSIAQHNPKLFKGDMFGLHETDLKLPATVEDGLDLDESNAKTENQGSARGSSISTGWFNGRGGARNPKEDDRMRFFRMIDTKVAHYLHHNPPLVLAGVESELVEYKNVSKYSHILETTIHGNQTVAKLDDLFEHAWAAIQKDIIQPAHHAAIEEYQHIHGANPERVATDKKSITEATDQGRVDKLLVRMSRKTSDTVRDTLSAATRITFPEPELSKSLNELAMKVWQMSGTVINVPADEMPGGAAMVARLRY